MYTTTTSSPLSDFPAMAYGPEANLSRASEASLSLSQLALSEWPLRLVSRSGANSQPQIGESRRPISDINASTATNSCWTLVPCRLVFLTHCSPAPILPYSWHSLAGVWRSGKPRAVTHYISACLSSTTLARVPNSQEDSAHVDPDSLLLTKLLPGTCNRPRIRRNWRRHGHRAPHEPARPVQGQVSSINDSMCGPEGSIRRGIWCALRAIHANTGKGRHRLYRSLNPNVVG
ncbi:hypothetical protein EDB92DRAFT_178358 [Lactarius akahatsu]|uniref:Uncharacterized protein n=1 Tax=Lactarius akahatsu TaxID=416441 RepID=A0AAD4L7M0_9AGAM|nr:hypothetical protein EDB92DRAFT_178358 [Lactarius akahatsu]